MKHDSKIYIAGHTGLVGSAILRLLTKLGFSNLITTSHKELDLTKQEDTLDFFAIYKPEFVFLAAAKVGGIYANNTYPANFIYENLMIQTNTIEAARKYKTKKLLLLGSSCIYPKFAHQPISETELMTGHLEPTNAPYALAKIAGIMMCESYNNQYGTNFISCMPTNLYGPGDNYDEKNSHVLPALIRKIHEAKEKDLSSVQIWGTGNPLREFLYIDDLADACVFLMQNYNDTQTINIGSGIEISIKELAITISKIIGYKGEIKTDCSHLDGTPRKLLDSSKINSLGWKAQVNLNFGIRLTYDDFLKRRDQLNGV
jgi:GDP-L-fucose synthase